MYPVIQQIVHDTGIGIAEADCAFKIIAAELLSKVPELEQIMEDVFARVETDQLKQHLSKVITLLQQHDAAVFKNWIMPESTDRYPRAANPHIL